MTRKKSQFIVPVVVFACNRVSVTDHLHQLIRFRTDDHLHPIIVSQDCGHKPTKKAIESFGKTVELIEQPDLSDIPLTGKEKKFQGYYKIARHYKWALDKVFEDPRNFSAIIITEDDLNISPDFFEYFESAYEIMRQDPTIWCISAWNDNGKENLLLELPDMLHRTDFFPGLGWLLTRSIWREIGDRWPKTFWDDWMRNPEQRKDRVCIRPEIPRTTTFGRVGVSKGQFFDKHLKFIKLNSQYTPFKAMDLSYLSKARYDTDLAAKLAAAPVVSAQELKADKTVPEVLAVKVLYSTDKEFKAIAKLLGVMEDIKAGVPRMAYNGVVSVAWKGRRVFIAPSYKWTGYDPKWK